MCYYTFLNEKPLQRYGKILDYARKNVIFSAFCQHFAKNLAYVNFL